MTSFPLLIHTNDASSIEGIDNVSQYLGQTLLIHLTDGRLFNGTLCMTDNRGHLVLQGNIIWPHSSSSSAAADIRWMGTVAIAPEHICKIKQKRLSKSV